MQQYQLHLGCLPGLSLCSFYLSTSKYLFFFFFLMQIWDLASGKLKLSLTGHISTVRGVIVSARSPYLFSCGEDKQVKCWDLEYNKVSCSVFNWN